jgi:predicted GIY-YIG superfamily endonuclease
MKEQETIETENFIGESLIKEFCRKNPFVVEDKIIGYPFNINELIKKYDKYLIPDDLGIYHLFYNDQLIYIGMSKSIRGRLLQHLKDDDMPFNYCLWFVASYYKENATIKDVLEIEYKLIKKFKPVLNSKYANCR